MAGYVEGVERGQATLFPDRLDDFIDADNPVRVVDAFVDALGRKRPGGFRDRARGKLPLAWAECCKSTRPRLFCSLGVCQARALRSW